MFLRPQNKLKGKAVAASASSNFSRDGSGAAAVPAPQAVPRYSSVAEWQQAGDAFAKLHNCWGFPQAEWRDILVSIAQLNAPQLKQELKEMQRSAVRMAASSTGGKGEGGAGVAFLVDFLRWRLQRKGEQAEPARERGGRA